MTDRKKPGVAYSATVALVVVLFGYPVSFGPACWIASWNQTHSDKLRSAYRPMLLAWDSGPYFVAEGLDTYTQFGARRGWQWTTRRVGDSDFEWFWDDGKPPAKSNPGAPHNPWRCIVWQ